MARALAILGHVFWWLTTRSVADINLKGRDKQIDQLMSEDSEQAELLDEVHTRFELKSAIR